MNVSFYVSIDRLPLGTVAAIEFLPVALAATLRAPRAPAAATPTLATPAAETPDGAGGSPAPSDSARAAATGGGP